MNKNLNSISSLLFDGGVLNLAKSENSLKLMILNEKLEITEDIASFNGFRGFILGYFDGKILLSIDNKLILADENGQHKTVLKSENPQNFFWHAANADDMVFVHEYGETPTRIFASENIEEWKPLITNIQVDRRSKHFHYIGYDPYRRWLLATLGDGCLTRVVYSEDMGESWRPLYMGPWQFVPIQALKDKLCFGMDSGIANGGIGVYYPDEDKWDFIFFRWVNKKVRYAQMNDLKNIKGDLWLATLGTPQAIIVSKDLRTWYPIFIAGINREFNPNMLISIGKDFVACSTGENLILLDKEDLERAFNFQPVIVPYKAYWDKIRGFGFTLKRKFL